MKVGIEAIHFDIPKLYLPIETLANARNIEAAKLQFGLGLERMSIPDVFQDSVVFGANAIKKLIDSEEIKATEIDRIYVGTESGVDGSKPIASYLISLIEAQCFESGDLSHVDVVDLTFACIGGVDALQNSVDFIKANPTKKSIVVCTDIAKYDLESTGEYTQGAGAVALWVTAEPSLLSLEKDWAVSTQGVFDFFKPRRRIRTEDIEFKNADIEVHESMVELFKEQPVFDGPYSNKCYLERTEEAYFRLKQLKNIQENSLFSSWSRICMHLPYCFQARRIFSEIFIKDTPALLSEKEQSEDPVAFVKQISKGDAYKKLVQEKIYPTEIASAQIGNLYTASLFMGLLSALSHALENESLKAGDTIGFLAYGSGSKSKAFEGIIQKGWEEKMQNVSLFSELEKCKPISLEQYYNLHQLKSESPILAPRNEFYLDQIEEEKGVREGARYYQFAP